MEDEHLPRLMHVVAKHAAGRPAPEDALGRLPGYLASLELPLADDARRSVMAWLAEDWATRREEMLRSAERQRTERIHPSS